MMKLRRIFATGAAIVAITCGNSVLAQSVNGEDNLQVGFDVQIAAEGAVVNGLEDIYFKYDANRLSTEPYEHVQLFCAYSPTRFLTFTIAGRPGFRSATSFNVIDDAQADPTKKALMYNLYLTEAITGGDSPIGPGANGLVENNVPVDRVDFGSLGSDRTCSNGENMRLTFSLIAVGTNSAVLRELVDGQLHSFADTITITATPEI